MTDLPALLAEARESEKRVYDPYASETIYADSFQLWAMRNADTLLACLESVVGIREKIEMGKRAPVDFHLYMAMESTDSPDYYAGFVDGARDVRNAFDALLPKEDG